MRKILSFLTAILFAGSMMAAEELKATLAFDGTVEWGIPTSGTNTASASFTADGYTIQLASTTNYKQNSGYLILGKAYSTLTLPAFTWKTTKIVVTGRSGASASVKQNIYVGETAVSTETTGATGVNEYVIAADYQAAGNVYVLNVTSGHNTQIVKIEVYGEEASQGGEEPVVEPTTKTIYCSPFSEWHNDGARFAVYAYGDGDNTAWYDLVAVEGAENVYSAEIAEAFPTVIFCRMNGATTENNWDNKWNQTADLTLPTDGKNLYTITGWNENDGTWSVYTAQGGDDPVVEPEVTLPVVAIAGTMNEWSAEANVMVAAEDSLSASVKIALEAQKYEFKVVSDGQWLSLNGEGETLYGIHREWNEVAHINGVDLRNFELTADVAGEYTFTWTYADSTLLVTFPEKSEEPIVEPEVKLPVVAIAGTMNEWSAEANVMVAAEDSLSASVKIALEAQKYEFKVVSDGQWLSLNGEGETLYGIHREWNEVAHINGVDLRNFELTADVAGEYTFTWTYADSTLLVTFPEKPAEPVVDEWAEIKFTEAVDAADLAENASFGVEGSEFSATITDTGDKMSIDANSCRFGDAEKYVSYSYRLKSGGKSSSSTNFITFNIPADGKLRIAVRTGSNSATDRNLVLAQGTDTLFNQVILESSAIKVTEGETEANVYPYVIVDVKAGSLVASYPKNGVNFYSFAFKANPVVENPDFYIAGTMTSWADNKIAVTGTSYKLNLEAGDYQLKVIVGEGEAAQWKGYDALTTVANGLTRGEGENNDNICFTLEEAGEVNVHYDGEFFFLNGDFYVAPVEVKYYLKNNWGGESWTWKEMTALDDGTYMLYNVVVGGEGVNRNTAESEEGASWFAWADIETFDASYAPATIGALDTVVIYFDPEAVNSFMGVNGMSAQILGKYVPGETPQPVEHTYTVAGNLTAAFGTAWDPANEANDMVKQEDGTYKWEKAELTLAAGTVLFKVCEDHAWDVAYPEENYQLAIAEDGEYTITITFNPGTKAVDAVATKTGDAEVEHTYTVAGNSAAAFGTGWAQTEAANDMVKQEDGTYKWEKTELVLPAGTIEFKVVVDHAWDVAYPNDNYQLAIVEAGEYTITITFDPETKAIAANAEKTAVVEVDPTVSAKGSWDEWANELAFVLSDDKATATLTVNNVAAGTYEFKVILNGGDWRSNSHVFTREAASSEGITGNDNDNMQLVADVEGEYTFTWTFATNSLAIEFPEGGEIVEPTLANGYYLIGQNGWNVAALSADLLFTANPGKEGEYVLTTTLAENDHIKVVKVQNDVIMAWYPDGEGNEYIVDAAHAGEGKAIYFQETYKEDWSAFGGYIWIDQNEATAISNTAADAEAVKVLHNGMLLIRKGNKTYNVMGQAVK